MKYILIVFLCFINSAFAGVSEGSGPRYRHNPYSWDNPRVYLNAISLNQTAAAPAVPTPEPAPVPAVVMQPQPQRVSYQALDAHAISIGNDDVVIRRTTYRQRRFFYFFGNRGRRIEVVPVVLGQVASGFAYNRPERIGRLLAWILQEPITIYGDAIDIAGGSFPRLYGGIWIRVTDFARLTEVLQQRGVLLGHSGFDFARNPAELERLGERGDEIRRNHRRDQPPTPFFPVRVEERRRLDSDLAQTVPSNTYVPNPQLPNSQSSSLPE